MPKAARSGLVILEAILALAVLAVVLGLVARAAVSQDRMATDAKSEVAARQALSSEVERIRALPFDELIKLKGTSKRGLEKDPNLPSGAIALEIAPEEDDSLWRIGVTVTWRGSQERAQSRTLTTLRARAGGPR